MNDYRATYDMVEGLRGSQQGCLEQQMKAEAECKKAQADMKDAEDRYLIAKTQCFLCPLLDFL